jgi:hypothetical protein
MTIRPRAVKALRDVRERMRDAAAATHATASSARERSELALAEERKRFEEFLDGTPETLASARNVYELDQLAEDTGVHRLAIVDAEADWEETTAVTEATALRLRERTRQLRSAERLVEASDEIRAKAAARVEQSGHDDMSSSQRQLATRRR